MIKEKEFIVGFHAVEIVLKTRPQDVARLCVQENRQDKRMNALLSLATAAKVRVEWVTQDVLTAKFGESSRHQGVMLECRAKASWNENDLLEHISTSTKPVLLLILDGVQDPHNLGACLRSANAFGVAAVIIPKDRSAKLSEVTRKVASGAAEITPVIAVTNLHRTLKQLQNAGVWLVGLDDEASMPLKQINLTGSIGIVMGSEGQGIRRLTRAVCDYLACIPMHGTVESLNVSVATGITLYEVQRQRSFS